MTYVNEAILFALIAVSIPILIHLFNRRKARVIDWGAMQFLKGSLVNRKRRVLIEELVLMALRCLLVAAIILAVARPFSPIGSRVSWFILLPVILIAAVLLAIATIVARKPSWRWLWVFTALIIAGGAIYLSQNEKLLQATRWKSTAEQDIAIVLDGSGSMGIKVDGKTNFEHAIDEAKKLISALGPDDHVSLIVAGGIVKPATDELVSVRGELEPIFANLKTVGGEFNVIEALSVAASELASGSQPTKKVVIISDGQGVGWESDNVTRWEFAADTLNHLPTKPTIVTRFLPLPESFQNACVSSVELNRTVIGTDREVVISVQVENTGYEPIEPSGIQMQVDEQAATSREVGLIEPGESKLVSFRHQFQTSGAHSISVKLLVDDDLIDDNSQTRIAQVLPALDVLLVDGSGELDPLEMPTTFADIALTQSFAESDQSEDQLSSKPLISTQVIKATNLDDLEDYSKFEVIMLMDVPRLGSDQADKIVNFVQRGGGLLVVPGDHCEATYYQNWQNDVGNKIMPASLEKRVVINDGATKRPVEESFKHPALAKLLTNSQSNISKAVISAYWQLDASSSDPSLLIGATMDGGEPLLVEKTLGLGRIALTAISLDARSSDLPVLTSFPPFLHELTYSLAAPSLLQLDRSPDQILVVDLPHAKLTDNGSEGKKTGETDENGPSQTIAVRFPDGSSQLAKFDRKESSSVVSISHVFQPGLYQLEVSDQIAEQFPQSIVKSADKNLLPFSVSGSKTESDLVPLREEQQSLAVQYLDYENAGDNEQLIAVVLGNIPGHELWKYLAIGAVLIVLAESFVTRWIAQQRKMGTAQEVDFVSDGERLSTFQTRARELLAASRAKS